MSQYEMKNWKEICEEKDAEIKRLNDVFDNVLERVKRECREIYNENGDVIGVYRYVHIITLVEIIEEEVKNARSK